MPFKDFYSNNVTTYLKTNLTLNSTPPPKDGVVPD